MSAKPFKRVTANILMDEETKAKLDQVSQWSDRSRCQVVRQLIRLEWNRIDHKIKMETEEKA